MEEKHSEDFYASVKKAKVPILVLDEKWHHLCARIGKPETISSLEKQVDQALAKQGRINDQIRELKKAKNLLMKGIVENMDGAQETEDTKLQAKKLNENKRLMDDANNKLAALEDELLEVPVEITQANEQLMLETMSYCYEMLRENESHIQEIGDWISQIRKELKKNIVIKQNREQNNQEIYEYMHDIFGAEVINLFDLTYMADKSVEK